MHRRNIHRQSNGPAQVLNNLLHVVAGLAQHAPADVDNLPGCFRHRNKQPRRHQAAFRMLPAHQRLYPANLGGGGIYQRLVMHHKLIALDRLQQFPANGHMLANGTILLAGVPLPGIAPRFLASRTAVWAWAISAQLPSQPSEPDAIPMLALICTVCSPTTNGRDNNASTVSAVFRGNSSVYSLRVPNRMPNSSPPRRARKASFGSSDRNRPATACNSWSPTVWPRPSLIVVKPSRFTSNPTSRSPFEQQCSFSNASKLVRLGKRVSGSWVS